MTRSVRAGLTLLLVAITGFALRAGSYLWTPLPFNPDGVVYAGLSATTRATDHLPLSRLATDELLFTPFLAITAEITGLPALYSSQPVVALAATVPCLFAVALARRFAGELDRSPREQWFTGLLAGGLLAAEGIYLYRSMPVDEQSLGLLLAPLAVYAFVQYQQTRTRRWLLLTAALLVVLPPLHNLDSVVTAIALTVVLARTPRTAGRSRHSPVVLAGVFWLYALGYPALVDAYTPAATIQTARLTAVPGLFLAWIVAVAFLARARQRLSRRGQRVLLGGLFAVLFGLVGANAITPVFPGTRATEPVFLAGIALLVVPALLAVHAVPWLSTRPTGRLLQGLFAAPIALIGLSLTAGLTPEYLNTALRVQTFLHLPGVVLAATGLTLALDHVPHPRRAWARPIATAVVVACVVASVPLAFAGLHVLTFKAITTPAEFQAASFAHEHVPGAWASDDHVTRLTWYHTQHGIETPRTARRALDRPVYTWLQTGAPPPACPTVVQASWQTTGAQLFPAAPERLSPRAYEQWRTTHSIVYTTHSLDPLSLGLPHPATPGSNRSTACR